MNKQLTQDAENMIEVMERTATRCDIWQDRIIYHLAKAIYDIIVYLHGREVQTWRTREK